MNEKSCDVLVIGGGGAGLVAGVRAADLGKKVIILEKAKFLGGGMLMASTMRTFRSKWQKERNIPDVTVDFLRYMMDLTNWRLDPQLAKAAVLGTGQFFDWYSQHELPEELAKYHEGHYIFDDPRATQIGPEVDGFHKGSGEMMMKCMIRYGQELGVEMLTEHAAKDVVVENGKIVAVISDSPEGGVRFNCDKCIIASAGWIRNQDLVKEVEPGFLEADVELNAHQNKAYTGEALKFAEKVGAYIDRENFCLRLMGPLSAYGDRTDLDTMAKIPQVIMVNEDGKRFVAEPMVPRIDPFSTGHVLLQQPRGKAYFVYSKNMLEQVYEINKNNGKVEQRDVFAMPTFPEYEVMYSWFEAAQKKDPTNCGIGDTIEEAAEKIGINAENMKATLEAYNKSCEAGEDMNFFKDAKTMIPFTEGPYIIAGGKLSTDGAFGGILINPDMQAYTQDKKSVVKDLYVAGDAASGRHIVVNGDKHQFLNDMSWAVSTGFLAGTNAAK